MRRAAPLRHLAPRVALAPIASLISRTTTYPPTRKHTYRTIEIQNLKLKQLLESLLGLVVVAIDLAKEAMAVRLSNASMRTHALVRISHPRQ